MDPEKLAAMTEFETVGIPVIDEFRSGTSRAPVLVRTVVLRYR